MEQQRKERSIGELFGDLTRELGSLVRQEVNLAKTEMTQKVSRTGKDIGFLAVGGAIAYAGFLGLCAVVIILLGEVVRLPWWLSALIVAVIVAAIGYFLVQKGLNELKRQDLTPKETIETLKEDVEWAKNQTS